MTTQYTAEQIKELTTISYWPPRRCSICGVPLAYHFKPDKTQVAFDSSCDCNRLGGWTPSSWDAIAATINMQTKDENRDRMIAELKGEQEAHPE